MKKAVIVAGMAYGDEAKGATVDFLCRDLGASLVVRYNGGHQAAHNVVLEDGRHHTFSQFGSGTFIPGVKTYLSRFMLVNPLAMMCEEEHLLSVGVTDAWQRTTVDENCVVVTPYHRAFNRLEEISRGHRAHGSCGVGIGVARRLELEGLALRVKELGKGAKTRDILRTIRTRLQLESVALNYRFEDTPEVLQEQHTLAEYENDSELSGYYRAWLEKVKIVPGFTPQDGMIFEGAQGVLLDEKHGTAPHNTWTNTTFENAFTLLNEAGYQGEVTKIGCWRSYFTRHGSGPFPSESQWGEEEHPELHNTCGRYQGRWRIGSFDYDSAEQATKICGGVDEIAISHMDYRRDPSGTMWVEPKLLEDALGAPVTILSYGPTAQDRMRAWTAKPTFN